MNTDRSIETTMAYQKLKQLTEGETCSYDDLRVAIDMDPQRDGYRYVKSARRIVERENDCVLEAVAGQGIMRLPPRQVVNRGGKDLAHTRRHIKSSIRRQTTLVPIDRVEKLNNEERSKFLTQLSVMGAISIGLRPSSVQQIEKAVTNASVVLPGREALALFVRKDQQG